LKQLGELERYAPTPIPAPPQPKTPIKLYGVLVQYAIESFACEYNRYPLAEGATWKAALITKIEQMVMAVILNIDGNAEPGIQFHATYDEIRARVRKGLQEHAETIIHPLPPPISTESNTSLGSTPDSKLHIVKNTPI
jgi:hypothetical protein